MKTKYILIQKKAKDVKAMGALTQVVSPNDIDIVVADEETEASVLNNFFKKNISVLKKKKYTHICLVPAGSFVSKLSEEIFKQYVTDKDSLYLPFVELNEPANGKEEAKFKAFINTSTWKPHGLAELGKVNLNFARAQMDLTLYGALIPVSTIAKFMFKPSIKYYYGYEFLSRIVKNGIKVVSIPKITFTLFKDLTFKEIDGPVKSHFFKAAQHECLYNVERELQETYEQFSLAPSSEVVETDNFLETVK